MNSRDQLILDLLHLHGPSTGLSLVKGSDGRLGRGTVYVRLQRLIDAGLVSEDEPGDSPWVPCALRRVFVLTKDGMRARVAAGYVLRGAEVLA